MMRFVLLFLALATIYATPARADGQCVATHTFRDGQKQGARQIKPSEQTLGFTMTAQGCLEMCLSHRSHRAKEGKGMFRKMEYSCSYGGKTINKTTQTLY